MKEISQYKTGIHNIYGPIPQMDKLAYYQRDYNSGRAKFSIEGKNVKQDRAKESHLKKPKIDYDKLKEMDQTVYGISLHKAYKGNHYDSRN